MNLHTKKHEYIHFVNLKHCYKLTNCFKNQTKIIKTWFDSVLCNDYLFYVYLFYVMFILKGISIYLNYNNKLFIT